MMLGAQQSDDGFRVVDLTFKAAAHRLNQRDPVHCKDLGSFGSRGDRREIGRKVKVDTFGEYPGGTHRYAE